jgi:NAD(P)H-dependent FMN reductase
LQRNEQDQERDDGGGPRGEAWRPGQQHEQGEEKQHRSLVRQLLAPVDVAEPDRRLTPRQLSRPDIDEDADQHEHRAEEDRCAPDDAATPEEVQRFVRALLQSGAAGNGRRRRSLRHRRRYRPVGSDRHSPTSVSSTRLQTVTNATSRTIAHRIGDTLPMAVNLLLVSGSLRARSTSSAVLRTAQLVAPNAVATTLYDGMAALPHFNQDDDRDPLLPAVVELRAAVHAADAVVFSTPEYAGALPGSFKNLLDWLIGDAQPRSIYEKPVAWINASPRGAPQAHAELRTVLGFAHATVVDDACVHVPVTDALIDDDGMITDADTRNAIAAALTELTRSI